jgi:hypothetical protein
MIRSAPFSFVRFENPADNDYTLDLPYSLPVFDTHNLAFQFIVDDDKPTAENISLGIGDENGNLLFAFFSAITASIVSYRYRLTGYLNYDNFYLTDINIGGTSKTYNRTVTREEFADILLTDFGLDIEEDYILRDVDASCIITATYSGSPTTFAGSINAVWHQGYMHITGQDLTGTPKQFTYVLLDDASTVIGYSNLFTIVEEEEYSSLVAYSCNESGFGFTYPNCINIVRLPFYLLRPNHQKKRTVNRQSNGVTKVLSALVEKEYEIATEQMPEVFHECMTVMLSHDNLIIDCPNVREKPVNVIESDSYAAQWENEEERQLVAKGKGKVKVSTFGYSNSNC